ncbi:MAG: Ig-like domain-containing protein [Methanobacteriota archaeon]
MRTAFKVILTILVISILIISAYAAIFLINIEDNIAPSEAQDPSPSAGATGVSITADLEWVSEDPDINDTVRFDVFFGAASSPPEVSSNQSSFTYDPGILLYDTVYFWRVIARDSHNASSEGPIWNFTTIEQPANTPPLTPSNPNPGNTATGVSVTTAVSWTGGDSDSGDTVTYDVYFGTSSFPPKVGSNRTGTSYSSGTLQYNTRYYWRIISWDSQGASTEGPVWSFTTKVETGGGTPDYTHTVFIEEATAGWCNNCPAVAAILHELYGSDEYRFYYVSMVSDENTKAKQRLEEDYNVYGYPTVYIDGGYQVIVGKKDTSVYEDGISAAMSRDVPNLQVTVKAELNNATKKFKTTVTVTNGDQSIYTGRLKVYLTEKVSQWYDYNGVSYSYGFLDYIIDKTITVLAGNSISESKDWDVSQLDPENLMIFAVVFSNEKHQGYSQSSDQNPFDAYYADATNAAEVVKGGNLPPSVGIAYPKKLKINIFGNAKRNTPFQRNTVIMGRLTITVNASAFGDASITRVEFAVDDKVQTNDTTAPYEWTVRKFGLVKHLIRRHTITVTAYDNKGKSSSASVDVVAIFL